MRRILLICVLIIIYSSIQAQSLYFPPLDGDTWETMDPANLSWCPEKLDSLNAFLEENNSKSFILLTEGKIAVESYFGNYTQDSLWYWASAGKSLMGVLIGLAQEDGHLDIEEPSSNYLGEGWTSCSLEEEAQIRIRHHISMATGLDDSQEEPGGLDNCFYPECFECIAEPETRWAYHNAPYRIMQNLLETATGTNKTIYTRIRLGNRIGMNGFWFNYIYLSTARDMARFGLFILNEGTWEEDVIMGDQAYFQNMTNTAQQENLSYGYLWWLNGKDSYQLPGLQFDFPGPLIPEAPNDMIAALGKNDQKIYVVPSLDMVVIRQGNSAGGVTPAYSSFDNQLWQRIMGLECLTATEEVITESDCHVYPNPTNDLLRVETAEPISQLQLFDTSGSMVRHWQQPEQELSLQGIPSGLYVLKIWTQKGVVAKKIVVR